MLEAFSISRPCHLLQKSDFEASWESEPENSPLLLESGTKVYGGFFLLQCSVAPFNCLPSPRTLPNPSQSLPRYVGCSSPKGGIEPKEWGHLKLVSAPSQPVLRYSPGWLSQVRWPEKPQHQPFVEWKEKVPIFFGWPKSWPHSPQQRVQPQGQQHLLLSSGTFSLQEELL